MEVITKYNQSSDWIESFLNILSNNYKQDLQKEAKINVKTLPKVVWNNNTFYVLLDEQEKTADVLNEYGNVVTTIKNASSLEDVEQNLNNKVVFSSQNNNNQKVQVTLDDELNKVAKYLSENTTADTYSFQPDSSTQNTQTPQNQEMTSDPSINGSENTVTNTPSNTSSDIAVQQMNDAAITSSKKSNNKDIKLLMDKYNKKLASLEQQISSINNVVNKLVDDIHAYINPGNIYDLRSEDEEVQHFNDTAEQSAKIINIENKTDLTTPYGRVSLKNRILDNLDKLFEEENKNAKTYNDASNLENNNIIDIPNNNISENETTNKPSVVKLNAREASIFKTKTCPYCGNHNFSLKTKTASIQNIACKHCKTKFKVDLNTEEISKYTGGKI